MTAERGSFYMTEESVKAFLAAEGNPNTARVNKSRLMKLYRYLQPEGRMTRQHLQAWTQHLETCGHTAQTVDACRRCVNRYLAFAGRPDLKLLKDRNADLSGKTFGALTVLELTEKRSRRYRIWRCRCSCGREMEVPTAKLLSGEHPGCGCRKMQSPEEGNLRLHGTTLGRALREEVESSRSASGYTGVTCQQGKWTAYINYRGKRHYLGTYEKLEDAVEARARGKAVIRRDAERLLKIHEREKREKDEKERRQHETENLKLHA